jgi:hypothetical protein
MTIMPGFDRHPKEAALIGRLLVAFGEIEVSLAVVVGNVGLQDLELGLRSIYKVRGTASRLELADALVRQKLIKSGLEQEYFTNKDAIKWCQTIRNQFAHCIWADDLNAGLFFTDLQDAAERVDMLRFNWRHVDVALLTQQLDYFDNTLTGLIFLENEGQVRAKKKQVHDYPAPKAINRPPLHNPPSLHVPPWIDEDEKRQHLEIARATENVGPQPERPPSVLRLTREEWAAKDAKDARLDGERPA